MAPKGQLSEPVVGQPLKVHLQGESPWAECLEVLPSGSWRGRIDNDLVCTDEHGFSGDDEVVFRKGGTSEYDIWVPDHTPPHGTE